MAYALQSMLRIRTLREDRAQVALVSARPAQALAERELDARRGERSKFEETRESRRDRIYDAVIGRKVRMDDLDRAREAVTRIDEKGVLLTEAVRKATETVEEKVAATAAARGALATATRERTKILEHKSIWLDEVRREEERQSDAETDEFADRGRDSSPSTPRRSFRSTSPMRTTGAKRIRKAASALRSAPFCRRRTVRALRFSRSPIPKRAKGRPRSSGCRPLAR